MRGNPQFLAQVMQQMAQQNAPQPGNSPQPSLPFYPGIPNMPKRPRQSSGTHGKNRAIKDPKKAFGALSKLAGNMNPQQLKQLQQGMGDIFGQNFGDLGAGNKAAEALGGMINEQHYYGPELGPGKGKHATAGAIQNLLGQMGLTGPGGPGGPGINPPGPPPPPVGINPPPGQPPIGFPPGPPGVMGQPSLNLGQIQGTMGMVGQPPQPPSLAQTAAAQTTPASVAAAGATGTALPATPGTGQATSTPAPTGQPAAAGRGTPAAPASTTPTPTATSANTSPVTGPVTAPQIQNAIGQSPVLNQPVHNNQDMFQGMYGGMINMPGQAEVAAQANTPGRSFVGNQFGQGGMVNNQMQQLQANAAQQGIQNATQMIGTNVQHGLQQDQTLAGMDFAQRQAGVQGLTDLLSPQLAGTAAGYQQGLQGLARTPQFMGF